MYAYLSRPSSSSLQEACSEQQDLLSFVFATQVQYGETIPLYIDAGNPSWSLNLQHVKQIVQTLIAGFQSLGIEQGDCVLIHLSNNVSPISKTIGLQIVLISYA